MTKYEVPYSEFKRLCLDLVPVFQSVNPEIIVCVTRGGLTAAHIIAKAMNLPVAFVASYDGQLQSMGIKQSHKSAVVVDDMVDQGRTFSRVQSHFELTYPATRFYYAAVYKVGTFEALDFIGEIATDRWLVMPNEESCKVVVGDKNLFSEGKSNYGTN